jgi:hypothetical protein
MPEPVQSARDRGMRRRNLLPAAFFACLLCLIGVVAPGRADRGQRAKEGDSLKVFDRARVYVVTNDDAQLGDTLLAGTNYRERRVLTLKEWAETPKDIRRFVSVVFLVNRAYLPLDQRVPEKCLAERDELYLEVSRMGYQNGPTYEIILSAPDGGWLRKAVDDYRKLTEIPRGVRKRNVRSLAVVPVGAGAARAAEPFLANADAANPVRAHLIPALDYPRVAPRLADQDELFLIDRSAVSDPAFGELLRRAGSAQAIGAADTAIWRERKAGGRFRVYISGPTAENVGEALRRYPNPLNAPETPAVVHTARDLRGVRRVAVATIKREGMDEDMIARVESRAASELRALDAFEVLERAGLSEVLGEVALGQAGITRAADRNRVRQLAAADALLIVDITNVEERTDYGATFRRTTGRMGPPPKKPDAPSRLRIPISLPGKEGDVIVRTVTDAVLGKAVGRVSSDEYRDALFYYSNTQLPEWQRQMARYEAEKRNREIAWEQTTLARGTVKMSGSLRLVDLTDGMVLWEAPFAITERGDYSAGRQTVTTRGDDSVPGGGSLPQPIGDAPNDLVLKATDTALADGIRALRGTALLPTGATAPALPAAPAGKILDIDGDLILVGLGASDGLKVGDTLTVALPDGSALALTVTRVRPRTCDATWDAAATVAQKAGVAIGQEVGLGRRQ